MFITRHIGFFCRNSQIDSRARMRFPHFIAYSDVGAYTYIARNSRISHTSIGKFCSIGANFFCGYGIHPINGISTNPMFYSTNKQNGLSFSKTNKIEERKHIYIGNDVFIGINVSVLDGVTIGNGAVIGAGAVVSKDIPPYAVAVGCPIKVIKYRFTENEIEKLEKLKWWDWNEDRLKDIEVNFWDIKTFLNNNI